MRRHAVRLSILLFLGLACAAAPTAATATPPAPVPSFDLDLDLDALHVSTITDTIPGPAAEVFQARAGDPVHRIYLLRNDGLVPLADVAVHDPDAAGVSLRCGHAGTPSISTLAALSWASCSATFTAVAGKHRTDVSVTGTATAFHRVLSGWTVAGYAAVGPGLQVRVSFGNRNNLPPNSTVPATVTIANTGTVELRRLTMEDTQPLSGISCGSHGFHGSQSALPTELDPGESVRCSATLATSPGTHSGSLTVAAWWFWASPITVQGPQFPRWLTIRAVADTSYTAALPVPKPVFKPRSALPPPPSPSAVIPAAVPPPPSPKPSPPRSPSPTPTHAVLFGNPQYPVSRGLPLPLKVLAIVVVPAIAVGRRAASSLGRN